MSKFIKAADIKALITNVSQMESQKCSDRQAERIYKKTKIITVGDSITHGSYPALLQMLLNAKQPEENEANYEEKEANYNYQAPSF